MLAQTCNSHTMLLRCPKSPIFSPIVMSDNIKDEENKYAAKATASIVEPGMRPGIFRNSHHHFVVKKTEKLASAVYVLTGFLSVDEPVRIRLRVCALELITRASDPAELSHPGSDLFSYRCGEMSAVLETARMAGLISENNATLLKTEYEALATYVRGDSLRITDRGVALDAVGPQTPKVNVKGHNTNVLKNLDMSKRARHVSGNNNDNRRKLILDVFNTKPDISIKDVSNVVEGVSEKTLQRDLLSLVSEGVLVKSGSRRWTTYRKAPESAATP